MTAQTTARLGDLDALEAQERAAAAALVKAREAYQEAAVAVVNSLFGSRAFTVSFEPNSSNDALWPRLTNKEAGLAHVGSVWDLCEQAQSTWDPADAEDLFYALGERLGLLDRSIEFPCGSVS